MQKVAEQLRAEEAEVAATRNMLLKTRSDLNDLKYALQRAQEHTTTLENKIKVRDN